MTKKEIEELQKELAAKNREIALLQKSASIESALEKIRVASLAMKHSSEFNPISLMLFEELSKLGVLEKHNNADITIIDPETGDSVNYSTQDVKEERQMEAKVQVSDLEEFTDLFKQWIGTPEELRKYKTVVLEFHGERIDPLIDFFISKRARSEEDVKAYRQFGELLRSTGAYHTFAFFSHGFVNIGTQKRLSTENADILQRFAATFEQTYIRFLDLQNAEQQARELALLLKEIHHRVKNNLQTISSLLNLQSANIEDENALEAVQESQNRVRSMALIHQKLYQGENLAAIEMKNYFETIGETLVDSFGEKTPNVSLEVPMQEIELDVDTAIPIGLIVNELLTNSLKYAFPNQQKGKIAISLTNENNELVLKVKDNGIGIIEEESSLKRSKGFGSRLIQLLTIQLNGKLEQLETKGTTILIKFKSSI